jgi:hypothetical protein
MRKVTLVMKDRILMTIVLVAGLIVCDVILQQQVIPERMASLSLQQLAENGAREELRVRENLSNWIMPALASVGFIAAGWIWWPNAASKRQRKV